MSTHTTDPTANGSLSTGGLLGSVIAAHPNPAPASAERRAEILADPGFGRYFTDNMVRIRWDESRGWHDGELVPYGPLTFDPATNFIHYGQAIFEGLKAYRHPDGQRNAVQKLSPPTCDGRVTAGIVSRLTRGLGASRR